MEPIRTYRDFLHNRSYKYHLRSSLKGMYCFIKAVNRSPSGSAGSIRFIHYHHVFSDEIKGFEKQLVYLKRFGDFLSMDEACECLQDAPKSDTNTYFCLSFDDGFKSINEHAIGVLQKQQVPAVVFLPTDYIGLDERVEDHVRKIGSFYPNDPKLVPFLNWDECRDLQNTGLVTFGSHTESHLHLAEAGQAEIISELTNSKQKIEKELAKPCHHFAAPWGFPGKDYDPAFLRQCLQNLGYKSLSSSRRGKMEHPADLFEIRRDQVLAKWGTHYLDYFLGK